MGARTIVWGENSLFNAGYWDNWRYMWKRMKLDPHLTPYSKVNLKWTKDPNMKIKTIQLLEGNRWKSTCSSIRQWLLLHDTKNTNKEKVSIVDFIKIKNFIQVQWLMPVIPATPKAGIGRLWFEISLGKMLTRPHLKSWAWCYAPLIPAMWENCGPSLALGKNATLNLKNN
jgi:hypothetical protein